MLFPQKQTLKLSLVSKPDQTLLVEINDEWVVGGDDDVEPQVPLVTVDQKGVVNVLCHHHGLVQGHLARMGDDEDPSAPGRIRKIWSLFTAPFRIVFVDSPGRPTNDPASGSTPFFTATSSSRNGSVKGFLRGRRATFTDTSLVVSGPIQKPGSQ